MKSVIFPRRVLTPAFVCVCGILLGTIMVRQYLVQGMGLIFEKQRVLLRRPLSQIPARLGEYEMVYDEVLSAKQVQSLGTSAYFSRIYRDTRKTSSPDTAAAIWFHAVYYTGTAETIWVRHVPDECFVGAGNQKIDNRQAVVKLGTAAMVPTPGQAPVSALPVNLFHYLSVDTGRPAYAVYFFIANGHYAVSRQELRLNLLDIRKKQSYYCKIELLPGTLRNPPDPGEKAVFTGGMQDADATVQAAAEFLTAALPEFLRCLPGEDASR